MLNLLPKGGRFFVKIWTASPVSVQWDNEEVFLPDISKEEQ